MNKVSKTSFRLWGWMILDKIAYMLPSQQVLERIARKVKKIPNRRKESKRGIHFGFFARL